MDNSYEKRGYLLEDFRLFHLQDAPSFKIDYHYHEFNKLLLLVSGTGSYNVAGTRYVLQSGDLVLVGSRCVHRPEFESAYERIIIYISPNFLQQSSSQECNLESCFSGVKGHVMRLPQPQRNLLFSLASDLEKELSSDEYGRDIISSGILLRLLVEIGRCLQKNSLASPSPIVPNNDRILKMLEYIEDNLTGPLSIDALADQFFLSKYHMMRLFRQETGTTIHAYISERRLLLAKELIANGTGATEACFQSGFKSYCAFTRAYGKRFGTTPTGRKDLGVLADETYE